MKGNQSVKKATYNLESGEETTEFFSDYFGTQMEVSVYDFEEVLSFEGELKDPTYGDFYSTEYYNDQGLGANLTIKGTIWGDEEEKPYSLTLFYDKKAYDKYAG